MTTTDAQSRLLSFRETAEMLSAPEATLRYWVHIGNAPKSAKIGRRRVFRESDVQEWIDKHFKA